MLTASTPDSKKADTSLNPSRITQIGMGFWPSKVLLTGSLIVTIVLYPSGKFKIEVLG